MSHIIALELNSELELLEELSVLGLHISPLPISKDIYITVNGINYKFICNYFNELKQKEVWDSKKEYIWYP